ncbi:hypothetical protein Btru_016172 [Bulinus truncatus]|nr:hypothetical protein Btru_016172 [Bulinus truncatus]
MKVVHQNLSGSKGRKLYVGRTLTKREAALFDLCGARYLAVEVEDLKMLLTLASTLLVSAWLTMPTAVQGHGRLMDPPARNSMWRLGFPNPVNYNDNELYCGGRMTQWARNNGKCGVCGDPHHAKREHEAGGKYANGIIAREYKQGDVIDITVHITANHKGFFEFRICPVEDPKVEVTQECLDKNILEKADGNGTRYMLPESQSNQFFNVSLRLPADLTCNQCVIQWKYRTGNTWDKDETGKFCVGCGPQEEFYNCADVKIHTKGTPDTKKSSPLSNGKKGTEDKSSDQPKQSAILFTNEDSDAGYYNKIFKTGDSEAQKGKIVKETSKYSILSADGNSMIAKKEELVSSPRDNEIIVQALKKFNNPTNVFNAEKEFGLFESLSDNFAYPTGPSFVPYRWQAGVPKQSEAEELRKRFAYNIGGSQKVSSKDKDSGRSVVVNNQNEQRRGGSEKDKIYTASDNSQLSQREESSTDDSQNTKDKNFLRKWKMLKLKHLAAQQALSKPGSSVASPRQANHQLWQQNRQALQSMRENKKNRISSDSNSPFAASKVDKSKTGFRSESQTVYAKAPGTTSSIKPTSLASTMSASQQTSQRAMKKRLPTWLVTALRLKMTNKTEKTEQDHEPRSETRSEGNIHSRIRDYNFNGKLKNVDGDYQTNTQVSQNNVEDNEIDNDIPSFKSYDTKQQNGQSVINNAATIERRSEMNLSTAKYTHQTPPKTTEYPEPQTSIYDAKNEDKALSEDKDNSQNKEDTESLVRYILATLLARKNNDIEDKKKDNFAESNRSFDKKNKAASQRGVIKNSNQERIKSASSSWFAPTSRPAEHKRNSGQDGNAHNRFVNTQRLPGFMSTLPKEEKVSSQSYNGFIIGSDYRYNQGYDSEKSQESHPITWASHNAYDNSAAMDAYRQSLSRLYGDQEVTKISYNPIKQRPNSLAYQSPIHNRGIISTYQSNNQQHRNTWTNADSDDRSEEDFVQDPNHLWAMRAQKRQSYYRQQEPSVAQQEESNGVLCKALVAFGGGMDKWCTDNCNANFCPPTICICQKQTRSTAPVSSSYSSMDNTEEKTTGDWISRLKKKQYVTKADVSSRANHVTKDVPFYNPFSQSYVTSGQRSPPISYDKPHRPNSRSSIFNPFQTNSFLSPVPTGTTFDSLSGLRSKTLQGKVQSPRIDDVKRSPQSNKVEAYMNKNIFTSQNFDHFYDQSQNALNSPSDYNTETSALQDSRVSWLRDGKAYAGDNDATSNMKSRKTNRMSSEQNDFPLTNDADMKSSRENYIDSQLLGSSATGDVSLDASRSRSGMNCRAVGAYRGLDHFDEWCETTCYSSMCPLLMCECDN